MASKIPAASSSSSSSSTDSDYVIIEASGDMRAEKNASAASRSSSEDVSALEEAEPESTSDFLDQYDEYGFGAEKYMHAGTSGKQRNKREVMEHSNKQDPCGNTRVFVKNVQNAEQKRHAHALEHPSPPAELPHHGGDSRRSK